MKRILGALLALSLLLGGCAGLPGSKGADSDSSTVAPDTAEAAATPEAAAPGRLAVYYAQDNAAASLALTAYAEAENVELTTVDDPAAAGLAVLAGEPGEGSGYRDLLSKPVLAAAASRAGVDITAEGAVCRSLPLGRCLYGYWADGDLLTALLGENALTDLQAATWDEWSDFADTLGGWIEKPSAQKVTLNGNVHTLPAELPEAAANLNGVFALPTGADAFTGAAYSSALVAANWVLTEEALSGPLHGVLSCFELETGHLAGPDAALARGDDLARLSTADATALLGEGKALFYRGRLTDAMTTLPADFCQRLVAVPQKCELTDEDVTAPDYNVDGLLNYPVLVTAGRLAIPDSADEAAATAGESAILWLYASGEGSTALTETLGLITPWNTASDTTALGAMQVAQVSAGVVPGAELSDEALKNAASAMDPLLALAKWKNTDKADFVTAAEQALGVSFAE